MSREVLNILREANQQGIKIVLAKGSLSIQSNADIDPRLLQKIKENKERIIQYLEKFQNRPEVKTLSAITPYDRHSLERVPLSFGQERLWFIDQLQGSTEYHIPAVFRLEGELDVDLLENSLGTIIDRHEILRTVIKSKDGVGYQETISSEEWKLDVVVLKTNQSIEDAVSEYLELPFDLSSDYMFRACLYDLGSKNYVLAGVFHHIASDGWSQGILVSEFVEIYDALSSGRAMKLPQLTLQYADYALWQREYIGGDVLEQQLSYWQKRLKDVTPLALPTDFNRPTVQSTAGSSIIFDLDKELSNSLTALCKQEEVTLFMMLLSAFKVLLARYSGQEDICVGTPLANRTQSDLEGMIGFFVNTLALRSDLSGEPTFRELLQQVKDTTLEGYGNQLVPFEKVVERVVTTRDRSRSPLFQVLFALQNIPEDGDMEMNGLSLAPYDYNIVTSQFDLTLTVEENEGAISVNLFYNTSLFTEKTIQRLFGHYQQLLKNVVKDVTKTINSLSILTTSEEKQLLDVFSENEIIDFQDRTIVELFQENVKKAPDAIAIAFDSAKISYKELDEKSNQLAHYLLTNHTIEIEDLVGVKIERSEWLIIAFFGVLKAGGAYVPIDPQYPQERISYIEKDSNCKVIIDEVFLETFKSEILNYAITKPELSTTTDHLAYVIYTSGSTGKPKGVLIEQKGILNTILSQIVDLKITPDSNCLQFANQCFDASIWELLLSILGGATLHVIPEDKKSEIDYFVKFITSNSITFATLPPAFIKLIDVVELTSLDTLITAGEQAPLEQALAFSKQGGTYINAYGPTETSICATTFKGDFSTNVPIGVPIANTSIYILDKTQGLLPVGIAGELCIGGAGLARGYLNKEELTKDKFIDNPFAKGERLYRSGDLAKRLPDGNIEFIGRIDDQVKIRGYRIELGEIESVLITHSEITSCCVLARPDGSGNKRLIAYIVGEDLDNTKLEVFLKKSLPEYMVPMLWVFLDEMPLTSNGKIDKKGLPDPDTSILSTQEFVAPRNEIEVQLASIWKELLQANEIGINDNFFALGGHSLLSTRLVSLIRKELNVEIAIKDVFAYATIATLADYIGNQSKGNALPAVVPMDRTERIPLSFSQERLWFIDQLNSSLEYHIPVVLRLNGILDTTILENVFRNIIDRHEVLRTVIKSENGVGYQEIIPVASWKLETVKVEKDQNLEELLLSFLELPFDLSSDYMLRCCLYDLGSNEYVIACVTHHISSDGWSEGILVSEFAEIYDALKSNRTIKLPEMTLQYADYALWQRAYIDGQILEQQVSYWKDKLDNVTPLDLPTDYSRPAIQSNEGSSIGFELDKELSDALNSICQQEGVTLFMLLLSAFKVVLSRYSGQEDICVGTPIANRTQWELEGMIGFFVNTLALRSDLSGTPTFKELLQQVKETTLEGYDHQMVPFEKVVEHVVATRDMGRSPLFQVLFALQNTSEDGEIELDGLELTSYEHTEGSSKFDLSLIASENETGISLGVEYCTALFKENTIQRMLGHFQEILKDIAKDINQEIKTLNILTEEEENKVLQLFNQTAQEYPENTSITNLFKEQAEKTPDAIALVFEDSQMTYRELDEASNRLVNYLKAEGVVPETNIGILFHRGFDMIISILGVLKHGSTYVPLDPVLPQGRLEFILQDAGIEYVLSNKTLSLDVLGISGYTNLDIDLIQTHAASLIPEKRLEDSTSYIMYTSGTTGTPKGIMITDKNVITLINESDVIRIKPSDKFLQWSNYAFDGSVYEIFATLLNGATLHMIESSMASDGVSLSKYIASQELTVVFVTTALFNSIVEYDLSQLSSLRMLLFGGEKVSLVHVQKALAEMGSGKLIHMYGPTETTVYATHYVINDIPDDAYTVPIGKPLSNTMIYVLDSNQETVPIGVNGELCISGTGLAKGYLNREELTKEKFIDNPFVSGERLYRTGDLVKWLADGNIEFVGRLDDQVKIRGYRIELGEIENALSSHDAIQSNCILVKTDAQQNKRLVGYIVSDSDIDQKELEGYLKKNLPEYMIPQLWVPLDEMPLTSNGKINKKMLPDPDMSLLSTQEYVAPRNENEEKLAIIWQELLGVERIGVYDNFFELGGHSILATRLVSMIREEFDVEIAIREIFLNTTLSDLSDHLSIQSKGRALPSISLGKKEGRIPLSFSQERLWFIDQLQGNSIEYHIPVVLKLKGIIDAQILETSLRTIVDRHQILRTVIKSENGKGYQEVISSDQWQLESFTVQNQEELETTLSTYTELPFDLASDYMLRACLYKLGEHDYVLACVFHHIASDGWSQGILVSEFSEIYAALQSNTTIELPELSLQYSDYALWQRQYIDGEVLEDQLLYWQDKLKDHTPLLLPTDYTRPSIQSNEGANIIFEFDKELSQALDDLSKKEGVTLFMLLLSAFKVLLSRYSGQDDICVGTSIANRTQSDIEGMIGFFVSNLALRSDLSGNPSFREVLHRVKETTLGGYDNQHAPFEKVVDRVVETRDMSMNPLFQVLFTLQNMPEEADDDTIEEMTIEPYEYAVETSQFDLNLAVDQSDSGIVLIMQYCTALFKESTVRNMLGHYQELLRSIVLNPLEEIEKLGMLSAADMHQLLHTFNATEVNYPKNKTIIDLFEDQVQKTPDNVAIVCENVQLTYKELNQRANRVGYHLRENYKLTADDFVGIMLDRTEWAVIAILGTLKAGAAYIPIDLDYPDSRKSFIIEDSTPKVLITDSEHLFEVIEFNTDIFSIDIELDELLEDKERLENPDFSCTPDDLVYMIYTSGSTGNPKGVMLEHNNLVNYVSYGISEYGENGKAHNFPLFTSLSFDLTQTSIYLSLLTGGKLFVYRQDALTSMPSILGNKEITSIKLTPAHLSFFEDLEYEHIREIIIGGEALTLAHLEALKSLNSSAKIHNEYGPTEATIGCTVQEVSDFKSLDKISIGKPIANTKAYILKEDQKLQPIGVVGELCISGSGLARGYLNREELTNEKFISNPYKEGKRLYKTGDLAKWLPDGTIEFVGRVDDQVKIRGYRIELGEIESVLSNYATIKSSCVLARKDNKGEYRLIGYVVSNDQFDKQDIQEHLKSVLPDYMVPQLWVALDEMPLTNNGKIDKKSLPDPDITSLATIEYVAPRNEIEEQLVVVWQELLQVDQVGIHSDFFELGGHSILAIQMVSRINDIIPKDITVAHLFEFPTIALLETYYTSDSVFTNDILVALQKEGTKRPIFCAPPAGGEAMVYTKLSKLLGEDQPLYGFQCPGLDGTVPVLKTVEEMATIFIEEMQKIDPVGPYCLAGYSFGGNIICEMMRQLQDNGFEVDELLVFEAMAPTEKTPDSIENLPFDGETFKEVALDLVGELNNFFNTSFALDKSDLEEKTMDEQLEMIYEMIRSSEVASLEDQMKARIAVFIANCEIRYYNPLIKKNDVSIVVFKSEEENLDGDLGWHQYTYRDVQVFMVSGDHGNMLEDPYVNEVYEYLKHYTSHSSYMEV